MQFEYPEDRKFFANLLAGGDEARLDTEFSNHFDFRDPGIKRLEFNKIRRLLRLTLHQMQSKVGALLV
jgi:hypothetical protein